MQTPKFATFLGFSTKKYRILDGSEFSMKSHDNSRNLLFTTMRILKWQIRLERKVTSNFRAKMRSVVTRLFWSSKCNAHTDLLYVNICFKTTYLTYGKKKVQHPFCQNSASRSFSFFSAFYPDSKKSTLSVLFVKPMDQGKSLFTRPLSDPNTATKILQLPSLA